MTPTSFGRSLFNAKYGFIVWEGKGGYTTGSDKERKPLLYGT
jgi:hypothetical protein